MAAGSEEAELEGALTEQLAEQRESLAAVAEALQADAESEELQEMRAALTEAIADTEAALMEMKRSRLLQRLSGSTARPHGAEPPEGPGEQRLPPESIDTTSGMAPGDRCRFRHRDGLWYTGVFRGYPGDGRSSAHVDFAMPTRPHHLSLESVCRDLCQPLAAGSPAGRGVDMSALEPGLRAWGRLPGGNGLWSRCEVGAADVASARVSVHFVGMRGSTWLRPGDLSFAAGGSREPGGDNAQAEPADDAARDSDGPSEEGGDGEEGEEDEEAHLGLGRAGVAMAASSGAVAAAVSSGPQTDVAHFADWEGHTRGIASRIMAGMGYVRGSGLGRDGTGTSLPLEVRLFKPGTGLGADEGRAAGGVKKKRKRGGQRKREAKMAQKRRDGTNAVRQGELAAEVATGTPGIFSFININLGDKSEAAKVTMEGMAGYQLTGAIPANTEPALKPAGGKAPPAGCARRQLMKHHDKILGIQGRIAKLQEMLNRNRNDKVIASQVERKLAAVKSELAAAQADCGRAESALKSKDKQKKWMKF